MQEPIKLTRDFAAALDLLENSEAHVFITGPAGTGKSTLVRMFCKADKGGLVILAPTGIAALNVGGQTLHSFFQLPPTIINPQALEPLGRHINILYSKTKTILIDEISMVRADVLDAIDHRLRTGRSNNKPFGGVRMIFVGDLYQLPPVVTSTEEAAFREVYESPYFFSATVMQGISLETIKLTKVMRQTDKTFIQFLNIVRQEILEVETLDYINERHIPLTPLEEDNYVVLTARRDAAFRTNSRRLESLPGRAYSYDAVVEGKFVATEAPAEERFICKEGAKVVFLVNDGGRRFVNGSLGRIVGLAEDMIIVELDEPLGDDKQIILEPHTWEKYQYSYDSVSGKPSKKVIGKYKQYPLALAWAMTIHKSQGKSFDRVLVDIGRGAFAPGQTYVALSRCRTYEGLALKQPLSSRDFLTDPRIIDYYESLPAWRVDEWPLGEHQSDT